MISITLQDNPINTITLKDKIIKLVSQIYHVLMVILVLTTKFVMR